MGNKMLDLGNGQKIEAGVPNVLVFKGDNAIAPAVSGMSSVLGVLEITNGTTFNNSEATEVTLKVSLSFGIPKVAIAFDLPLILTSTDNGADPVASADIVTLVRPNAGSFVVDDVKYGLELSFGSLNAATGLSPGDRILDL